MTDVSREYAVALYTLAAETGEQRETAEALSQVSACFEADPEYLRDMIRLVNRTQLMPQDVLSDSLYFFDRETGKITIA